MKKRNLRALIAAAGLLLGVWLCAACSSPAQAEDASPAWVYKHVGTIGPNTHVLVLTDSETGVQYIGVTAHTTDGTTAMAITPRLGKDGALQIAAAEGEANDSDDD